jgi:hypothetical protein
MRSELASPPPFWPATDLAAASLRLDKFLRAFGGARDDRNLTSDEVLIFLAVGRLGLTPSSVGVAIHPVTCLDVSKLLKIPAETVRRKAARLVEIEFLARTTRGLLVQNVDEWRWLAETVLCC